MKNQDGQIITPASELEYKVNKNAGTSWTRNDNFDENGYVKVKDLYDVEPLYESPPMERGLFHYQEESIDNFKYWENEEQCPGSLARYYHPKYKKHHDKLRKKIEELIGRTLYATYYYDRFYFVGNDLPIHVDRPSCEISVSINISTNIKDPWPLWVRTPSGEDHSINLEPGDGLIYKGCERPHWRDAMSDGPKVLFGKSPEYYYHQVFFHYVLQDGQRAHYAWDKSIDLTMI